jgi:hypothetical protein
MEMPVDIDGLRVERMQRLVRSERSSRDNQRRRDGRGSNHAQAAAKAAAAVVVASDQKHPARKTRHSLRKTSAVNADCHIAAVRHEVDQARWLRANCGPSAHRDQVAAHNIR